MIQPWVLVAVAALASSGCVPYRLGAADLLETNAQLASRRETITPGVSIAQAAPAGVRVTEETVQTGFGALALTRVESALGRPLVVFCGGSAFRQEVRGALTAAALSKYGDVWLFDYPGYGRSEGIGAPAEFEALVPALAARIQAAYADGRSGRVILLGHSFGGGVCARLAAALDRPSTLVLVGAFRNYPAVVRARAYRVAGPLGYLVRPVIAADVPYADIVDVLQAYRGDVLVAASRDDAVVPFSASASLARDLSDVGKRTRLMEFETGDHVRFQDWPGFETRLQAVLAAPKADPM